MMTILCLQLKNYRGKIMASKAERDIQKRFYDKVCNESCRQEISKLIDRNMGKKK
jgi:hypothetical protein